MPGLGSMSESWSGHRFFVACLLVEFLESRQAQTDAVNYALMLSRKAPGI